MEKIMLNAYNISSTFMKKASSKQKKVESTEGKAYKYSQAYFSKYNELAQSGNKN